VEIDREALARKIQEATDRIRSGESDFEEIQLPNESVVRIRKDPDGSGQVIVEAQRENQKLTSLTFPATESRPTEFPEDLPFLANTNAMLSDAGEKSARTMVWPDPSDAEVGFESLRAQLTESGWEETSVSEKATEDGDIQSVDFARGDAKRSLFMQGVAGRAQLLVVDHPPMQDEAEEGEEMWVEGG
jgi:hypothetical protein